MGRPGWAAPAPRRHEPAGPSSSLRTVLARQSRKSPPDFLFYPEHPKDHRDLGRLNQALGAAGLKAFERNWLSDPNLALYPVIIAEWRAAPEFNAEMNYVHTGRHRPIRVYRAMDQRFILAGYFAKLARWHRKAYSRFFPAPAPTTCIHASPRLPGPDLRTCFDSAGSLLVDA